MIITPNGYDSQDEDDQYGSDDTIMVYPKEGDLLVLRRVLTTQPLQEEPAQGDNLFHSRCTIKDKICHLIVDSGSCTNIASIFLLTS